MEQEVAGVPDKVLVCDSCGEKAVVKCYFCGKDLCARCMAWVEFMDREVVRGKAINFYYHKPMCKGHLPERRDCE